MSDNTNVRISWQEYFAEIAKLVAKRSPCKKLHVGCVIVKDKRIISTGYNGFLCGAPHISIEVDGHELATVHAEQNCISDCAKRGVSTENAICFITHYPCINCYKVLVAGGIKEIYYLEDYKNNPVVEEINKNLDIKIVKL